MSESIMSKRNRVTKNTKKLVVRKRKRIKPLVDETCPHCSHEAEAYRMYSNAYKFDVDMARAIVSDGREPIELEPDDVIYALEKSHIYPQHLAHVDTQYPGIVAHYWGPDESGMILHGTRLIDGHHRAARCLQLGIPFFIHLLTEVESLEITMRAPGLEQMRSQERQIVAEHVDCC